MVGEPTNSYAEFSYVVVTIGWFTYTIRSIPMSIWCTLDPTLKTTKFSYDNRKIQVSKYPHPPAQGYSITLTMIEFTKPRNLYVNKEAEFLALLHT